MDDSKKIGNPQKSDVNTYLVKHRPIATTKMNPIRIVLFISKLENPHCSISGRLKMIHTAL